MKMTFAESFGIVQTHSTPGSRLKITYLGMCHPKRVVILRFLLPNFHTISREQKPCREIKNLFSFREILVITWPYAFRVSARPYAPQKYQGKIFQSTGMATQMQLEVILAGNRIATRVLWSSDNLRFNKDKNEKWKLFLYPCQGLKN